MIFRSAAIAVVLVGSCSYVYFCPPLLTTFNGGFLLFPYPAGPEFDYDTINGVKRDDVYFKNSNGDNLNAWFFQNPENKNAPVVLFSHGNGGNISHRLHLIKALMDAGASVFIFDYRAYGRSSGSKNLQGVNDDAEAAFNYLVQTRKIPIDRIVLYGESIGGGPACELARRNQVGGLILDSTFTSLLHVGKKKVGVLNIYPDFLLPNPAFDNRAVIAGKHPPLLIIHGQKDELIPVSEANENFEAASEPKTLLLLPQSTHNSKADDFSAYVEGLTSFFKQLEHKGSKNSPSSDS